MLFDKRKYRFVEIFSQQGNYSLSLREQIYQVPHFHSRDITQRCLYVLLWACTGLFFSVNINAQSCPSNIDFESGTFDGWTCYTGNVKAVGGLNVISLQPSGPMSERHTMYSSRSTEVDPYGGFPVTCPNGSGYSVKLGNNYGGGQAEGMSYEFTIPANQNSYSIVYNYAVVFQQPHHSENEQPRMEIEITNVTDGTVISCASFTFIAIGSSLPGFEVSNQDTVPVLYKNWTPVSVDLSGNAGKTIRLFFKTADCTFIRHFGYAYIDVNSECGNNFIGSVYCPDDTVANITAPFGYQSYTWYDNSLSHVLGTEQTLSLSPAPHPGISVAVKLEPYPGYGCPHTLVAQLADTLKISAYAGRDTLSCNMSPVPIGTIPKSGLVYIWNPVTGLSDPNVANPIAFPGITTNYSVLTTTAGGGCRTYDTVRVKASVIDTSLQVIGKPAFCLGHGDSAVLKVQPTQFIQWYRNNSPIGGAVQPTYRVPIAGNYYALMSNSDGCKITTRKQPIIIDVEKPGIRYPVQYAIMDFPLTLSARKIGETALWQPAVSLENASTFEPVFKGTREQLYTIEIRTIGGCLTIDTQLVKMVKAVEIYVPTAFTPNRDGLNDYLHPILRGVKELRYFRVYNRWGEMMYESRSAIQPGWDGNFRSISQPGQPYVWMVECIGLDGITYYKKGSTVLLR